MFWNTEVLWNRAFHNSRHSCFAMPLFIIYFIPGNGLTSELTGMHMYTFSVFTLNTILMRNDGKKFYLLAWCNTAKQTFVKWITLRSGRKLVNKGCGCHYLNYLSSFFFFLFHSSEAQSKMRMHPNWACLFKVPLMKCYFFQFCFCLSHCQGC